MSRTFGQGPYKITVDRGKSGVWLKEGLERWCVVPVYFSLLAWDAGLGEVGDIFVHSLPNEALSDQFSGSSNARVWYWVNSIKDVLVQCRGNHYPWDFPRDIDQQRQTTIWKILLYQFEGSIVVFLQVPNVWVSLLFLCNSLKINRLKSLKYCVDCGVVCSNNRPPHFLFPWYALYQRWTPRWTVTGVICVQ